MTFRTFSRIVFSLLKVHAHALDRLWIVKRKDKEKIVQQKKTWFYHTAWQWRHFCFITSSVLVIFFSVFICALLFWDEKRNRKLPNMWTNVLIAISIYRSQATNRSNRNELENADDFISTERKKVNRRTSEYSFAIKWSDKQRNRTKREHQKWRRRKKNRIEYKNHNDDDKLLSSDSYLSVYLCVASRERASTQLNSHDHKKGTQETKKQRRNLWNERNKHYSMNKELPFAIKRSTKNQKCFK